MAIAVGAAVFVWTLVAFDTSGRRTKKVATPGLPVSAETLRSRAEGAELSILGFDLEHVDLSIVDTGMSQDLGAILDREKASLVVNAGFFDEHGEPLGLSVSEHETLAPLDPALGGGVIWIANANAKQSAAEEYGFVDGTDFALQSKPRLVVNGVVDMKSDDHERAPRTALCLSKEGHRISFAIAWSDHGWSLSELAAGLVAWGCSEALNLDGGPSTGAVWLSTEGRVEHLPRAPIRQAIVVRAR